MVGFRLWDISENSQSERWLDDEREIRRGPDEGGKKVVQLNALEIDKYEQIGLVVEQTETYSTNVLSETFNTITS